MKTDKPEHVFYASLREFEAGKAPQSRKRKKTDTGAPPSATHDDLLCLSSVNPGRRFPGGNAGRRKILSHEMPMPKAIDANQAKKAAIEVQILSDPATNEFIAELHVSRYGGQRQIIACVSFAQAGFNVMVDPSSPVGRQGWAPSRTEFDAAVDAAKRRLSPLRGH